MAIANVAVGWKGYVLVDDGAGGFNHVPYTSEDVTEKDTHIPSADVHGGGISQQTTGPFFSQLNAADGLLSFDGSINGHVYAGAGPFGSAIRQMFKKGIDGEDRLEGFIETKPFIVSPGGAGLDALGNAFRYPSTIPSASVNRAIVTTVSVTGSAGNIIDYTVGFMSTTRETTTIQPVAGNLEAETAGDTAGENNPVAWHNVNLAFNEEAGENIGETPDLHERVTDITIDVNNNSIPITTFNRSRNNRDLYQGEMEVTGNFTYYSDEGTFASLNKIFGSDTTPGILYSMGGVSPIIYSLTLVVTDPAPIPGPGVNDLVTRNVGFRALATRVNASLKLT